MAATALRSGRSKQANELLVAQSDPTGRWEVVAQIVSEDRPIVRSASGRSLLAAFVVLGFVPVVGCRSVEGGVGEACDEAPADRAPTDGNCTAVDWDVVAIDGRSVSIRYYVNDPGCSRDLDRVDITEDDIAVRVTVLVEFVGSGGSCPTSLGTRETAVELAAASHILGIDSCRWRRQTSACVE